MASGTGFIKVGTVERSSNRYPEYFDLKGHNEISQIFISGGENGISSIQFQYVENGKYVLSDKYGSSYDGNQFHTIQLNHPAEYITGVYGLYFGFHDQIQWITFTTNIKEYSPFGLAKINLENLYRTPFNYDIGKSCQFGGFHGTYHSSGISSIGLYIRTKTVPPSVGSKVPKKELK